MDTDPRHSRTQISPGQFQPNSKPSRAVVAMGHWFMEGQRVSAEDSPVMLHRVNSSFQALGDDIIFLFDRFQKLQAYERETLDDLRDLGVSVGDVVDYLRAAPGLNPEGKPIRTDVATAMRKREFQSRSDRIESSGRSAALLAGSAALLAVGAVVAAPMVLPSVAPTVAPAIAAAVMPVLEFVAPLKDAALGLVEFAAGGGALAVGWKAWTGWQKVRSGSPRLDIGRDDDFKDLPNSLGAQDYDALNDHYEAIPSADRYLLSHLSNTEMRMFLGGNDSVRKHLLSTNPPAPVSKIQARLDTLARGTGNGVRSTLKRVASVCAVLVTAPWHRDAGNGRIPDLERRLESWRANADMNRTFREERMEAELEQARAQSQAEQDRANRVLRFMPQGLTHPVGYRPSATLPVATRIIPAQFPIAPNAAPSGQDEPPAPPPPRRPSR